MIELHRLKGEPFVLNHRLIELIENRPDTVITLTNERRYVVTESPQDIVRLIQEFERKIFQGGPRLSDDTQSSASAGTG
ncbi:MAG: flagellar FlbD family protein [Leptospirales bacterium]|nr:flagellar FlbD family protein [Leptospirales bacterium]